jgi:hypothetical protein
MFLSMRMGARGEGGYRGADLRLDELDENFLA